MVFSLWLDLCGLAGWIDWGWVVEPSHMGWRWWHGKGSMMMDWVGIRVREGVMIQVWKKWWRWWEGDGGRGEGEGGSRHALMQKVWLDSVKTGWPLLMKR